MSKALATSGKYCSIIRCTQRSSSPDWRTTFAAAFGGLCLLLVASCVKQLVHNCELTEAVISTGIYMRIENRRRNKDQSVNITAADVNTEVLGDGPRSPSFRYMY